MKKGSGKEDAIRAFNSEKEITFTENAATANLPSDKTWPDENVPTTWPDHEPTTAFAADKDSPGTTYNDEPHAHDSVYRITEDDDNEQKTFLSADEHYTEDHSPASTSYSDTVNNEKLFMSTRQDEN